MLAHTGIVKLKELVARLFSFFSITCELYTMFICHEKFGQYNIIFMCKEFLPKEYKNMF